MKKLPNFDLNKVMTDVLNGVLFKDSGLWMYYEDDAAFDKGEDLYEQELNEDFNSFIKRVIYNLMQLEESRKDPEPLTTIDYAVYVATTDPSEFKLLENYSKFLEDNGYLDSDWRDEGSAIKEFLNNRL